MKTAKSFLALLLAFTLINCSKSDENTPNPSVDFNQNLGTMVSRDFIGQVLNENLQPVEGVEIKVGSVIQNTDSKGVFVIKNAQVFEKHAYITAKKEGFIDGSRALVPNSETNTVRIILLSASPQATITSGTSDNVILNNGAKVNFDGDFETASGVPYSGEVKVMMHHLDPADERTADKMPGSLMAQSSNGSQRILETYGMMNVELQDNNGNKLQIVNPTTIEMPISSSQLASAPATIPLWYFDETVGYWKEEGSATKVGDKYVGTVNHFSWWNCDVQFPTVSLEITVLNANQLPLSGVQVEIVRNGPNGGWNVPGYTNNLGQVSGLVPANENLTMNIYYSNLYCGNQLVYSQPIGPFSNNTVLQSIVVPSGSSPTTIIQGNLINCSNTAVTNGYVWLQYSGQFLYTPVSNGLFSFSALNCTSASANFTLQGYDFDTLKATLEQSGVLNNQTINLGTLQACSSTNTSLQVFDIDQNSYNYLPIGSQTWIQQNLNVSRYRNGDIIPQVTNPAQWANLTTGAWCYYNNDPATAPIYGKLYNWYAVNDSRGLAPVGTHIPSDNEWASLSSYLDGDAVAGGKLKEIGTTHWLSPNTSGDNTSGFTGLPGGYRTNIGAFININNYGYWWSATQSNTSSSWYCFLYYNNGNFIRDNGFSKVYGFSVRLIKD